MKTLFITNFIFKKRCTKCKSKNLTDGIWRRGWNELCQQATGDSGIRCYDCGHIVWKQNFEEYQKSLPKWCRAYKD